MALTLREFQIIIQSLWLHFFPKLEFDLNDKRIPVITLFYQYFQSKEGQNILSLYPENCYIFPNTIHRGTNLYNNNNQSYQQRQQYVIIHIPSVQKTISLPDFIDILLVRPKEVIGCIGIAISILYHQANLIGPSTSNSMSSSTGNHSNSNHSSSATSSNNEADIYSQMDFVTSTSSTSQSVPSPALINSSIQPIFPQLIGLQPFSPFYELKSESLDRLVSIVGYIVRVSHSRHLITGAAFSCNKCNQEYMIAFEDGIYCPPAVCPTHKCYNKTLDMLRHKVQSTDIQRIKIQEVVLPSSSAADKKININQQQHQQQSSNHHQANSHSRSNDYSDDEDDYGDDGNTTTHTSNKNHNRHRKTNKSSNRHGRQNDIDSETATSSSSTTATATDSRAPRTFEFEVQGVGMVNSCCIAGDVVNVVGIIKTSNDRLRVSFGKEAGVHLLYLDANSVSKCNAVGKLDKQPQPFVSSHLIMSKSVIMSGDDVTSVGSNTSALSYRPNNQMSSSSSSSSPHTFTTQELTQIRRIAQSPLCFSLLTSSLCPDIFGLELVKAGLVLGLLGGTTQLQSSSQQRSSSSNISSRSGSGTTDNSNTDNSNANNNTTSNNNHNNSNNNNNNNNNETSSSVSVSVRTDIHVLVVGDPGMGKSQLLRASSALSTRSVLVTGHSVSAAGLTASVSKESSRLSGTGSGGSGGGDVVIEAGALVLADKGVCCIDELDKIDCDYHALLEAMEQQSISIAKSGVITCLKSRAAILAAANPVNGHYNKAKSVQENLKMPSALLSRFDLVFILVDRPDTYNDQMLSEHIMRTHTGGENNSSNNNNNNSAFTPTHNMMTNNRTDMYESATNTTLAQRLRRDNNTILEATSSSSSSSKRQRRNTDDNIINSDYNDNNNDDNEKLGILNTDILRKYIEYAKKFVHPKLSRPAAKILQKQYLSMRAETALGHSVPVTTRHLESLIRLAQARAKVELREEVTAEDASDVVMLLQESLLDAFAGDGGEMSGGSGSGADGRRTREGGLVKQVKSIVSAMKRECEIRGGNEMFSKQDISMLCTRLRLTKDVDTIIDVLRTECYLLLKGPQLYRLQAT